MPDIASRRAASPTCECFLEGFPHTNGRVAHDELVIDFLRSVDEPAWLLVDEQEVVRSRDLLEQNANLVLICLRLPIDWRRDEQPRRRDRHRHDLNGTSYEPNLYAIPPAVAWEVRAIRDPQAIAFLTRRLAWEVLIVTPRMPLLTTDRPLLVNLGEGGPFGRNVLLDNRAGLNAPVVEELAVRARPLAKIELGVVVMVHWSLRI